MMAQLGTVRPMSQQVTAPPTEAAPLSPNVPVDGNAIRRLRIDLGYTLVGFAPRVPISWGYLSQIERGRKPRVSPPLFRLLLAALDLPPERAHEIRSDRTAAA